MNLFRIVAFGIALLLIQGWRHPIEIVGEGDVISASGDRTCTLGMFQAGDSACSENDVDGEYIETYYAVARPGWRFDRWSGYCVFEQGRACSFNLSEEAVAQFEGETREPLQAVFAPFDSCPCWSFTSILSEQSARPNVVNNVVREPYSHPSFPGITVVDRRVSLALLIANLYDPLWAVTFSLVSQESLQCHISTSDAWGDKLVVIVAERELSEPQYDSCTSTLNLFFFPPL